MAVYNVSAALGNKKDFFGNSGIKKFMNGAGGVLEQIFGTSDQTLIIGYRDPEKKTLWGKTKDMFTAKYWENELNAAANNPNENANAGVVVDGVMSYNGNLGVTLTKNPVQKNADINDHRIKQPKTLTLEVGVSNDVITGGLASSVRRMLSQTVNNLLGTDLDDRRIQTFENFKNLMYNGKPFTVVTPHGIYENMLLVGIRPFTKDDNIGLFQGYLDFQEVIMFSSVQQKSTAPTKKTVSGIINDKLKSFGFEGNLLDFSENK